MSVVNESLMKLMGNGDTVNMTLVAVFLLSCSVTSILPFTGPFSQLNQAGALRPPTRVHKPLPEFCSFLRDAQCGLEVRSEFCGCYHLDRVSLDTCYDALPGVPRPASVRTTHKKRLLWLIHSSHTFCVALNINDLGQLPDPSDSTQMTFCSSSQSLFSNTEDI